MSLRITQSMIYARALHDIRKSSRGILEVQEQVASGRRINRPSDDPAAMLRLLPLNSEILNLSHLKDNTELAQETLDTGAAALEEGSEAMQRVKELMVQAANGTMSEGDRRSIGQELDELLGHMVGIANSRRGNSYLFGGSRTSTPPFRLESPDANSRVIYDGSQEVHEIDVAPGITSALYSAGDRFFQSVERGATIFKPVEDTTNNVYATGAAATNTKDTGRGFDRLETSFAGLSNLPTGISAGGGDTTALGNISYNFTAGAPGTISINGGAAVPLPVTNYAFPAGSDPSDGVVYLDVTAPVTPASGSFTSEANMSIDGGESLHRVDFSTNPATVRSSIDDSVLNVDISNLKHVGEDLITYEGTFDVFTVLITARDILQNADSLDSQEVEAKLLQLVGEASNAHDKILDGLQELGIRSENIELLQSRLDGLLITDEKTRSNIRDTDLAESISEMTQKQFNFQASMQVSARIVQTSLLNFLR